ncbi:MAG: AAA family ATPase [Acidilobaceae archaeon]
MIIRGVELKNILSHEYTKVTFDYGVNVIVGPNGSGKSSIIDSILIATIGVCEKAREVSRSTLDNILRVGSTNGLVRIEFEIGGSKYTIERVLERVDGSVRSKSIELRKDEKIEAVGVNDVCRRLREILGVRDLIVLPSTLISRQGYLSYLIDMTPSERGERILELAGLSRLEEVRDNIKTAIKTLEREVARLEEKKNQLEEKRRRLREASREVKELENRLEASRVKCESLDNEIRNVKVELDNLERLSRSIGELKRLEELKLAIDREKQAILEYESRLESLPVSIINLLEELKDKYEKARDCSLRLKRLNEKEVDIKSRIEKYIREAERLGLKPEKLDAKQLNEVLDSVKKSLEEVNDKIRILNYEVSVRSNMLNLSIEDKCPYCGAPLTRDRIEHIKSEHTAKIRELEAKIREFRAEKEKLDSIVKYLEAINRGLEDLSKVFEEKADYESCINEYLRLCSEIGEKHYNIRVESIQECPIESIKRDYNLIQRLRGEIESSSRRIEEYKSRFNEDLYKYLRDEVARELDKLSLSIDMVDSRLESARRRYDKLIDEKSRVCSEMARIEGEISRLKEEIARLENEINELEKATVKLDLKRRIINVLGILANNIYGRDGLVAKTLIERLRASFEEEVNSILRLLGRDFSIRVGSNFKIIVMRAGQELAIESLSGGEKTMLSIASRLALAQILIDNPIRTLILDEPTEFLDENARKQVFEIIGKIAGQIDQVIVVTHDTEVEEIASKTIRVSKIGDKSIVEEE